MAGRLIIIKGSMKAMDFSVEISIKGLVGQPYICSLWFGEFSLEIPVVLIVEYTERRIEL